MSSFGSEGTWHACGGITYMQAGTHTCAAWMERFTGGIMVHGAEQIYSKERPSWPVSLEQRRPPPLHDSQIFLLNIFNVPKTL